MAGVADPDPLQRLRAITDRLPECAIEPSDPHAAFVVRKRTFAWFLVDHHGDGMVVVSVKVPPGENQAIVAAHPERFALPSYLAARGWVSVRLDVPEVDWNELGELVTDSYRMVAAKTLVKQIDASPA